jgi:acetamidase/formamidase
MAKHHIQLEQAALIGSFTTEATPIISVVSGDSLRFETLDAGWGKGTSNKDRFKPFPRREKLDGGHALIGPIYVEQAKRA